MFVYAVVYSFLSDVKQKSLVFHGVAVLWVPTFEQMFIVNIPLLHTRLEISRQLPDCQSLDHNTIRIDDWPSFVRLSEPPTLVRLFSCIIIFC